MLAWPEFWEFRSRNSGLVISLSLFTGVRHSVKAWCLPLSSGCLLPGRFCYRSVCYPCPCFGAAASVMNLRGFRLRSHVSFCEARSWKVDFPLFVWHFFMNSFSVKPLSKTRKQFENCTEPTAERLLSRTSGKASPRKLADKPTPAGIVCHAPPFVCHATKENTFK